MNNERHPRLTVAMIGAGGFANTHLATLLDPANADTFELVAAIDPNPGGCKHLPALAQRGIQIAPALDDYLAGPPADLVIVSTPIHLHCEHVTSALRHGSHVYCEKPVAATIQDARAMAEARDACDRRVAIGYQWSWSETIRTLKADIAAGDFGRPVRLRALTLWPRDATYYGRSPWAGQLKTGAGDWILDSPVSNATSHYLHNCFYVLGAPPAGSAAPVDVQAELYRANDITNYDSAAIRAHTAAGVEILFYTTHAVCMQNGPVIDFEFEQATVRFPDGPDRHFIAHFHDGTARDYGSPDVDRPRILHKAATAIHTNTSFPCEIESAMPMTLCANLAQESAGQIVDFPPALVHHAHADRPLTWVEGLYEAFTQCFDQSLLPSELPSLPWATPGTLLDARSYTAFPSSPHAPPRQDAAGDLV